jgi:hypothetical protein
MKVRLSSDQTLISSKRALDARHVEDHPGRYQRRHLGREVHLLAAGHAVEHLVDDAADRRAHRLHAPEVDHAVEQPAQPRVLGRVAEHQPQRQVAHHLGEQVAPFVLQRRVERREAVGGEVGRGGDRADVVVARDDPGAQRRAPVGRVLVLEPGVQRERVAPDRVAGRVVDRCAGRGAQCSPGAPAVRSAMVIRCSSRRWPS